MDLILCYFSPKVRFKYLERRYWTYGTVFRKYSTPDHIWWTWFYETFFKGSFYIFWSTILDLLFFLSDVFFMDIDESQDSRGREETIFYSTVSYPPAHEHSNMYLQTLHVTWLSHITRLQHNEIYHLIELPWWYNVNLILDFVTVITIILCITSEPSNHMW